MFEKSRNKNRKRFRKKRKCEKIIKMRNNQKHGKKYGIT
jgi:hypothetical protein